MFGLNEGYSSVAWNILLSRSVCRSVTLLFRLLKRFSQFRPNTQYQRMNAHIDKRFDSALLLMQTHAPSLCSCTRLYVHELQHTVHTPLLSYETNINPHYHS